MINYKILIFRWSDPLSDLFIKHLISCVYIKVFNKKYIKQTTKLKIKENHFIFWMCAAVLKTKVLYLQKCDVM